MANAIHATAIIIFKKFFPFIFLIRKFDVAKLGQKSNASKFFRPKKLTFNLHFLKQWFYKPLIINEIQRKPTLSLHLLVKMVFQVVFERFGRFVLEKFFVYLRLDAGDAVAIDV